jgi:hypothetical protein
MDNFRNVIVRDPENYPQELNFLLDLMTINETPKVVGSYAYKNHKYPSDVDVFERVTVQLKLEQAIEFYLNSIKNIVQKLLVYSDKAVINDLKIGEYPDSTPIRWTPTEILQGFSTRGNKRYSLRDALKQSAVLKLDVISYINSKFQSVEVFYNFRYLSDSGDAVDIYELGSYVKSLLEDVNKYSKPEYYNPLKVAKRMWSLARVTKCDELLDIINPLLSSNAAALNQIKSDVSIILDLLDDIKMYIDTRGKLSDIAEMHRKLNYHQMINQINLQILDLYKKINNHMDTPKLFEKFDLLFANWVNFMYSNVLRVDSIHKKLNELIFILQDEINLESKNYVDMINNMNIQCNLQTPNLVRSAGNSFI